MDALLSDCAVEYCLRVLAQSRLQWEEDTGKSGSKNSMRLVVDICLAEAVRVLCFLCSLNTSLVPRIFPLVRVVSSAQPTLEVLEFVVHHAPDSVDCAPLFRSYFGSCAVDDPVESFKVYDFCVRNRSLLVRRTSIFSVFFPALFKFFAWHPLQLLHIFLELISTLAAAAPTSELIHALLDLPLVAASLEEALCTGGNFDRPHELPTSREFAPDASPWQMQQGRAREAKTSVEAFAPGSSFFLRKCLQSLVHH